MPTGRQASRLRRRVSCQGRPPRRRSRGAQPPRGWGREWRGGPDDRNALPPRPLTRRRFSAAVARGSGRQGQVERGHASNGPARNRFTAGFGSEAETSPSVFSAARAATASMRGTAPVAPTPPLLRLCNVWALTCKREREARSADRRDCQVQCFVAQRLGWRFAAWASRSRKGYMPTGRQASGLRRRGPVARPAAKMKFKRRPAPESLMSRLAGWPR